MWCYKRTLKKKYIDHITDKRMKEVMRAKNVNRGKFRFAGPQLRGSSSRLMQLVLEGKIEGRRCKDRPRQTWFEDVKEWTKTYNLHEIK